MWGPVPPQTFIHAPTSLDTGSIANGGEHLVDQSRTLGTDHSSQQTLRTGGKGPAKTPHSAQMSRSAGPPPHSPVMTPVVR